MGVYLLLVVSGLALTVSFLHTGGADNGPGLNDRLDKLKRAPSHQERRLQQLEADKRQWEEDKRQWEEDKQQWEEDKQQWEEDKRQWEENKRQLEKTVLDLEDSTHLSTSEVKRDMKIASRQELDQVNSSADSTAIEMEGADSSFSHDVMSRGACALGTEIFQISQRLGEITAEMRATKAQMTAEMQERRNEIQSIRQDQAIQTSQASVFVRWGRSVYPNSDSLVYSGVVGGSWYTHSGAASNYLCVSMSPVFSTLPVPTYYAYLYGGEYQTFDAHTDDNPPCAVCRSTRPTTVMVPGTNQCPSGWTLEYGGHLMAGRYVHAAASEYICVDIDMEDRHSGEANENGVLLYYTITQCGSLPCPPYVGNKVVTCAVCSK